MTTKTKSKLENNTQAVTAPEPTPATPRPSSKIASVIALLEREEGATLDKLTSATGWQIRTARAALTGLKKRGYVIEDTVSRLLNRLRPAQLALPWLLSKP